MIVLVLLFFSGFSFAQLGDLDLSTFSDSKVLEEKFEGFNNGIHASMSALEWDNASAPDVLGFSAKVFLAGSLIEAEPSLGLSEDVPVGVLGAQVGFGTMGYEIYVRFLPELETDGADVGMLGFGLKYDLSDLIPIPALPSLSAYGSYNSMSLKITPQYTVQGQTVKSTISSDFSTINVGVIAGYDFIILNVYGKAGLEMGTTELEWEFVDQDASMQQGQPVLEKKSHEISSTSFRYAVGLSLFGFKLEGSGRGTSLAYAVGYGISF